MANRRGAQRTQLSAAERGLTGGREPPLIAFFTALARWWEDRHLQLMNEAGFDDVRRAHNAVIVNLPSNGLRLTEIAELAGISKQATAELVDDLVEKGYLQRLPDPRDGRAKIIAWAQRGEDAHATTLEVFAEIEQELIAVLGEQELDRLKRSLTRLFFSLVVAEPPGGEVDR